MRRYIFWIFVFLICLFLACLSTNYDYDLFARLIVGENFIENGVLPFKDFLSYTPTHPWYDHEWGSGIIFYLILKYIGPAGFIFFQAVMMLLISFFVVKTQQLQKHVYPKSILFISVFLIFFYMLNSHPIRCQLFSFLFFTIFLFLLELHKTRGSKVIWLIPLITMFWNNVHGGVVSGLGLIFIYMVCALCEHKPWKNYLFVLSASLSVLVINPYGFKYLPFLFSAVTMYRKYIVEWWPFYASRHILYYLPAVIYGLYALAVSIYNSVKTKKYDITKLAILLVTLYEGIIHVKLLSFLVISAAALCYNDIIKSFGRLKKISKKIEKCIYPAIITFAITIPLFSLSIPRADFDKFPLYEIEFLKANNIKGNIVIPFGMGSYASYKLYPDNLIFMDGRYEEVYNARELLALRDFELYEDNWDDITKNYDTKILMPLKTVDVYAMLKNNKNWVHIFDGRLCGIFVKKEDAKNNYYEPEYGIDYYRKTMFNGYFGNKIKK